MLKHTWIVWVGWGGFLVSLVGLFILPETYKSWAHLIWVVWTAAYIAFSYSVSSEKPLAELRKNAAIACLVFGGLTMLYYGEPREVDGYVEGGFPTTFDSKAGAGVRVFLKLLAGSLVGIEVAEFLRQRSDNGHRDAG